VSFYWRVTLMEAAALLCAGAVFFAPNRAETAAAADGAPSTDSIPPKTSAESVFPAQDSVTTGPPADAAATLDKMVVTAGRRQRLMERPQAIAVISAEEWIGTPKTLADVIAEQTGVQTRRFGGIGSFQTVSIRGVEGSEVLVLIDGIPLNSAMGDAVDLGKLNPSRFSRIEVYRSFIPARFGGNGLGGVVNLITVKPENTAGADIYSSIGTYHAQEHHVLANNATGDGLQAVALLSYIDSENDFPYLDRNNTPYNTADDTERRMENNQYTAGYFMMHPAVPLNDRFRLHAMASASQFKAHQPGNEGRSNKTAYNAAKVFDINVRLENESAQDVIVIEPAIAYVFREAYRFYTSLDFAAGASHSSMSRPNSYAELGSDEQTLTVPATVIIRPAGFLRLESCVSLRGADINPTVNTTGGSHGDWHSREASGSAALDAIVAAHPFGAVAGGSIQGVYSETEGGLDGYSNRMVPASDTITLLWAAKGGVSLSCADSAVLFYANAGRFSNQPSLRQRYGAQGAHNPNPTLLPETGLAAECGVKLLSRSMYTEVGGFYNRSWNKILTVFDGSQSASINCAGARSWGLEASLVATLWRFLQSDTRLTWQRTENLSRMNNWYGNQLPDEPALDIHESIGLGPFNGLSLRYGIELKSAYYRDPGNTEGFRVPASLVGKEDKFWEAFHNCKLEWKPFAALTLAVAGNRLTSDLLTARETASIGESGYQWVVCPVNQWCVSAMYSF